MSPANLLVLMVLLLPQVLSGHQEGTISPGGDPLPPQEASLAQSIQNLLLSRLGLQSHPAPRPGAPIPQYLLDLYRFHKQQYHLVEDPHFSFPVQHVQGANTVRSFHHMESSDASPLPLNATQASDVVRIRFNISSIPMDERVTSAELRLLHGVGRRSAGDHRVSLFLSGDHSDLGTTLLESRCLTQSGNSESSSWESFSLHSDLIESASDQAGLLDFVIEVTPLNGSRTSGQELRHERLRVRRAARQNEPSWAQERAGGIKPCVAAFGGDQFEDHQEKQRSTFFSIFYLSINAGSLLSTIITPTLRATECGSSHQQCYPLAFGVPAALMLVALIVFIAGSRMYDKPAPQGNIILQVCKCIGFALNNRFKHRSSEYPKREHWMDWASEKYDKLLIAQVKMVLKVLFLYIPLPMFWALFDQQGSRWTLQATTMDGNFGAITIQPDQMQTVNPILILVMVPVMDYVVYPIIKKCHLNFTPLRRMTVGMFLAAMAFIAAALVQIQIDKTMPTFPSSSESQVKFLNLRDTPVSVKVNDVEAFQTKPFEATADYLTYGTDGISVALNMDAPQTFPLLKGQRQTFLITPNFQESYMIEDLTSKPEQGKNEIRFVNGLATKVTVSKGDVLQNIEPAGASNSTMVSQGKSTFTITSERLNCTYSKDFGFGSSYTLLISSKSSDCQETIVAVENIAPNSIHMAWLIPQYFIMTTGEVVFSVTGLEFSYSQAPSNMKSVLQAGWLFTVAVGNIIVLIVAEAGAISEQWAEYVLFACLLMLVCIIFAIMAYFYIYVDPVEIEAKLLSGEDDEKGKNKEKDGMHMDSIELNDDEKKTKI